MYIYSTYTVYVCQMAGTLNYSIRIFEANPVNQSYRAIVLLPENLPAHLQLSV